MPKSGSNCRIKLIERARHLLMSNWFAIAALFSLLAVVDYGWIGLARVIDQRAGDVMLRINAQRRPESDRVVIVDIDQRSLEQMNDLAGSWPWPRSVHGELIDRISTQSPRAIAFDVLFNELDVYRPDQDSALADAVASHPNVLLAMTLNTDGAGARVQDMPPAVGAVALTNPARDARVPLMLPLVPPMVPLPLVLVPVVPLLPLVPLVPLVPPWPGP